MHLDERCAVDAVSLILDTFEGAHGPEGYLIRQGLADELRLALGGAAPQVALIEPDLAGGVVIESVYRLRGSLWRSGNRTRVTAHLIDGAHGNILLSRRFDAQPGTDDFTFVEQTARSLAASVMARLDGASDPDCCCQKNGGHSPRHVGDQHPIPLEPSGMNIAMQFD